MSFRTFLGELKKSGELVQIKKGVSADYEVPSILNELGGKPVLFENVKGHKMKVAGGICSSRGIIAKALGTWEKDLTKKLAHAAEHPKVPEVARSGECHEVVEKSVDLRKLPILTHTEKDSERYVTSAVCIIKDVELGRNMSFHRLMLLDRRRFAARIVENRGTYNAMRKVKDELEMAICIGNSIPVLLAAATSLPDGVDELGMANALEKMKVVRCKTVDLEVPCDCEIVLEGVITQETRKEGPFLDLTGTYDRVREQPVVEIKCITHRKEPIYQALLPGGMEHKLLMGMPREPTIFNEVNKVCKCRDVYITPGGCSWLHAVVQIEKRKIEDGILAIEAAFRGHSSLKHCIVVDEDIDIRNASDVEWALATRVQMQRDMVLKPNEPGSSLDPSAEQKDGEKARTCKAGIDATKKGKGFDRGQYKKFSGVL